MDFILKIILAEIFKKSSKETVRLFHPATRTPLTPDLCHKLSYIRLLFAEQSAETTVSEDDYRIKAI